MSIKVLLVDDHAILRDGLRLLIESQLDMKVVGEAENGQTAIDNALKLRPDVIIMDVAMPDMNGIEASSQILAEMPDVKILALSMHSDREYVMDMIKVGVSGYMEKECVADELIRAIHTVAANETYLTPKIATIVVAEHVDDHSLNALTDKEIKVLRLLADGISTRAISDQFDVNIKTIEAHRRRIMQKLQIDNFA
ncbi:unnamed protein product, partial [marine sediment metagenome]